MHPRVRLYMIEVSLLLSLWATKFFIIINFIEARSKNKTVYTIAVSSRRCKLKDIRVKPRIIPSKIRKKIYKIKAMLKLSTASGSR